MRLWDVAAMDGGSPLCSWDDCRGGHFNHAGTVVAAVSSQHSRCAGRHLFSLFVHSLGVMFLSGPEQALAAVVRVLSRGAATSRLLRTSLCVPDWLSLT